jgi:ATP-binding cassette subfamily B protein
VWIDPGVQLWNESLIENIAFGTPEEVPAGLSEIIEAAALRALLERMPDGLRTRLGESGARVSGGEGQRVRFARGLARRAARLVILDEPFRGIDRGQRRSMLALAREWWSGATLLCVTHDVGDTRSFDQVVILDEGRIVERGSPAELAADPSSRYAALLESDERVREGRWSDPGWRRARVEDGRVVLGGGDT